MCFVHILYIYIYIYIYYIMLHNDKNNNDNIYIYIYSMYVCMYVYIYIYIYISVGGPDRGRDLHERGGARKGTNGVSTDGVTTIFICFIRLCFLSDKSSYFCSCPISVDPVFVRSQGARCGLRARLRGLAGPGLLRAGGRRRYDRLLHMLLLLLY